MKTEFYEKFLQLKYDEGLCKEIDCTEEENHIFLEMLHKKEKLPIDIIRRTDTNGAALNKFFRVVPMEITHEEIQEYYALKQSKNLNIIKNCVVFFTILAVISLAATLILTLNQL
ncbi:MAG: hypothetical protein IJC19_04275 [Clostridia bacterium]|nr:hypothetical protein [Clostridia bacterium]